jgi:hypothetical protein
MRRAWPNRGCIVPCKHKKNAKQRLEKLGPNSRWVSKLDDYHIYIANIHILTADVMNITPSLHEKPCVLQHRRQRVTVMCWLHLLVSKVT